MSTRIIYNGKEYASLEEMPAKDRELYQRAMAAIGGAAVGEATEKAVKTATGEVPATKTEPKPQKLKIEHITLIKVNGRTYESADQMPAEIRKLYEAAMAAAAPRLGGGGAGFITGRLIALITAGAIVTIVWWMFWRT